MNFINKIFRGDRVIWMIYLFLCLISIVEVFSATSTLAYKRNYWDPIMRHTMFLLLGTGIVLFTHSFRPKYFSVLGAVLPVAWLLLILTKFFGSSVNNADRWISIFGISFQPSEIAKLSLVVFTAFLLSKLQYTQKGITFKWILYAAVPTCCIILIDNFSTAAMLFAIVCLMMFVGQVPWKQLGKLMLALTVASLVFVSFLIFVPTDMMKKIFPRGNTWKERIEDYSQKHEQVAETKFNFDDNYQVSHAKVAIARGGLLGVMPGNSQQRDYLPQAYSDFIYAIIIEELGLVGGITVLFLYVIFFIRSGIIASRCERLFPKYLVMGSALILVTQALANMAVAVNLIPVTGQPLPLISRGGTSTLITCVYIGIILSVSRFDNPKGIQREEEISEEMDTAEVEKLLNEDLRIENESLKLENEILKMENEGIKKV